MWPQWWEARAQADTLLPHPKDESQFHVLRRGLPVGDGAGNVTPGDFIDPFPEGIPCTVTVWGGY